MDDKLKSQADKYLTDTRLFRYYEIADENYLQKYTLNMEVSEKLLSIISIFEIIYRNKINMLLSKELGENYLTNSTLNVFGKEDRKNIKHAFNEAVKSGVAITNSRAITWLTLGFWSNLINNNLLWCKYLYKLFPKNIRQTHTLSELAKMIRSIYKMRNKISHHERIINKHGTSIPNTLKALNSMTDWLIEPEDKEFRAFAKNYIQKKSAEITDLLENK